jgi:CelD/BcsL family acetyltransferase involved in cellulose biosynthesis
MIILCRDEQGRLAGLAPLYVRQRRTAGIPHVREVMFLGTGIYAQTSEYLDVIARRGYEKAVAEAVAEHLKKSKEWDRLHLKEVPAGSRVMPHLMEAMGEGVEVSECNRSHHIDTTTDWDTFISQSARTIRRNVLRLTRRIVAQDGFRFRRIEREEELEGAMDALVRLHQARWRSKGEPGAFAIPGIEELLRGAAREGFREGKLRLWTMELNGEIAAVRLAFFDNGIVHAIQGGFDPAYTKESLGSVMLGMCIRDCIEDETVREYDLMGGTPGYKESWCKESRESLSLSWLRPGARSMAYSNIEQGKQAARSLVRKFLPGPLRIAARRLQIKIINRMAFAAIPVLNELTVESIPALLQQI